MAIAFDGISDQIRYPVLGDGSWQTTDPLTVSFWSYVDSVAVTFDYLRAVDGGGSLAFAFRRQTTDAGSYRIFFGHATTNVSYVTAAASGQGTGAWHHNLVTFPGGSTAADVNVYLDNVLVADGAPLTNGVGAAGTADGEVILGSANSSQWYPGALANLAMWDRVLTADERSTLFVTGGWAPYIRPNLVWWTPLIRSANELIKSLSPSTELIAGYRDHPAVMPVSTQILQFPPSGVVPPADKRGLIVGADVINAMNVGNTAINRAYIGGTEIFN